MAHSRSRKRSRSRSKSDSRSRQERKEKKRRKSSKDSQRGSSSPPRKRISGSHGHKSSSAAAREGGGRPLSLPFHHISPGQVHREGPGGRRGSLVLAKLVSVTLSCTLCPLWSRSDKCRALSSSVCWPGPAPGTAQSQVKGGHRGEFQAGKKPG